MLFTQRVNKNKCLIRDSIPDFKWEISENDSKLINGILCKKALAEFRGSKIVAYYTEDFPVYFGPWKFRALPGLIMEIYNVDSDVKYHWKVKRIVYPYQELMPNDLFKAKDLETISIKKYIEDRDKLIRKKMEVLKARMPKGVVKLESKISREGIEKIFEWEE